MNIKKMFQIILCSSVLLLTSCMGESSMDSVKVGDQEIMLANINVSEFQNGEKIYEAKNADEWIEAGKENIAAWCYDDFNSTNEKKGKLYNWFAVNDSRGLAPKGWHIPNFNEWHSLEKKLLVKNGNGEHNYKTINFNNDTVRYCNDHGIFRNEQSGNTIYNYSYWTTDDCGERNSFRAVCFLISKEKYSNRECFPKRSGLSIRCIKNK